MKLLKVACIAIVLNVALFMNVTYAQTNLWTYEQNFNTLSIENLDGQGSWSGSTNYDVSTNNPAEGSQCVQITGDATERQIYRDVTEVTNGTFYVSMRSGDMGHLFGLKIYTTGGGTLTQIWLHSNGKVWCYNGAGTYNILSSWSANTWYRFGIQIDGTNKKFKVNVNNGSWSDWLDYNGAGSTGGVYRLLFEIAASYSGNAAFDYISPNYTAPVTPKNAIFFGTGF